MSSDEVLPDPTIDLGGSGGTGPDESIPRLIVVVGTNQGARLELRGSGAAGRTIGRSADCDLVLETPVVSSRHARVFEKDGRFLIEDTDSTNGVRVNGVELAPGEPRALEHGDAVQLSDHVLLFVSRRSIADRTSFGTIEIDDSKASEEAEALLREFESLRRHRRR